MNILEQLRTQLPHDHILGDGIPEVGKGPKKKSVRRAYIIVLGNIKGGSGKSTTAMHLSVALVDRGYRVGAIDLDGRQQTLARYLENRAAFARNRGIELPMPDIRAIPPSNLTQALSERNSKIQRFGRALEELIFQNDFVVIDCPGSDDLIARICHSFADTLVSPMNDSFIDLDLIARLDPESGEFLRPTWYSEMVWSQRKRRSTIDGHRIDWVIMRNRLTHIDAHNKRRMATVLQDLAPRLGYRVAPGFCERVIYRELFHKGLTLLDLTRPGVDMPLSMSHLAARQEVRNLVSSLRLRRLDEPSAFLGTEGAGTGASTAAA
ncbi:division plane positioning ATPase MipZ [Oceanibacterium hippocampi]|uniref:Chromosome partitioning protein ParA n=1 Tax=Oceanibacterium hippocampi TaxID=745714 RepID=A0A1Y5TQ03_9PROT|nr:division plane positioning ATPase MipZ [Oceanibacterium hippocampi]SLN69289.1 Chromosome partitioning protein ParA [Oceanibacterium hippocampi]